MKLAFAVTETGPEAAAGDYFTALELGMALKARYGWQIDYRPKGDGWYDLAGVDLLVAMVEDYELPAVRHAVPGLITIAWARNWFERWCEHPWIADYSLLLASSRRATDYMSQRTGKLARLLRIATNPDRFNPEHRASPETLDYVFTGHFWQTQRDIVAALSALPPRYRGAIYGKHWEQVPELAHLHRGFVPYPQIQEVYRQATIVIDDANHVTKDWGAANSRVFDALAAGCLVITNAQTVSEEVFERRLPVYGSPEELSTLLDRYLNEAEERKRLTNELRSMVMARHCYSHRAMEFGLHVSAVRKTELPKPMPIPVTQPKSATVQPAAVATENSAETSSRLPSVSFVVPLFNYLEQTQAMLASLQTSLPAGLDYEIIFTDDASTDGTGAWLKTLRDPRIKVLLSEKNRGFAANNNAGVQLARGEVLGLLNNDLLFEPGWLEPMLTALDSPDLNAGLVGNVQYRVADGALDHVGVIVTPAGQFQHLQTLPAPGVSSSKALAVTGACMLLRKTDFGAVGGFDEQFVNGCEDIDLCFKLRAAGKAIILAAESRIRHHVSLSRKTGIPQDLRNSRLLFSRWRKEIKRELAAVWHKLLTTGPTGYAEYFLGRLSEAFLSTPHIASQVIAEAVLQREAAAWTRELGDASQTDLGGFVSAQGLRYSAELNGHVLDNSAEFVIEGLAYVSNFYVCGRRIDDASQPGTLTIRVNDLQTLAIPIKPERHVNAGVIDPLLLPGIVNRFRVETTVPLVLMHIVVDDQVVDL